MNTYRFILADTTKKPLDGQSACKYIQTLKRRWDGGLIGAPGTIRTCDRLVRSQVGYPVTDSPAAILFWPATHGTPPLYQRFGQVFSQGFMAARAPKIASMNRLARTRAVLPVTTGRGLLSWRAGVATSLCLSPLGIPGGECCNPTGHATIHIEIRAFIKHIVMMCRLHGEDK